jgi:hypothetical protein
VLTLELTKTFGRGHVSQTMDLAVESLGVMTGNAFINAQVGFRDLKTGETWATKTYDTKSSARNGVFAAMTTKQVRAMCHEMLGEVSAH